MTKKDKNSQIIKPQKIYSNTEKASVNFTKWVGSTNSLIIHTIFFVLMVILSFSGIGVDKVLLILTTAVSLEAIYLSIFIQMSINHQGHKLHEVSEDIEEIQEDVEEIQEDVDEIQKDVDEIQEDVEEIEKDDTEENKDNVLMSKIESTLAELMKELAEIKKK